MLVQNCLNLLRAALNNAWTPRAYQVPVPLGFSCARSSHRTITIQPLSSPRFVWRPLTSCRWRGHGCWFQRHLPQQSAWTIVATSQLDRAQCGRTVTRRQRSDRRTTLPSKFASQAVNRCCDDQLKDSARKLSHPASLARPNCGSNYRLSCICRCHLGSCRSVDSVGASIRNSALHQRAIVRVPDFPVPTAAIWANHLHQARHDTLSPDRRRVNNLATQKTFRRSN
jgi:hypothetical protein